MTPDDITRLADKWIGRADEMSTNDPVSRAHAMVMRNCAAELRTLAQQGKAGVVPEARYECRECNDCGHAGINDASQTVGACFSCEWSGPEPEEDKCPGCGDEGCMTAACPKCGARYRLVAELETATPPAHSPDAGVTKKCLWPDCRNLCAGKSECQPAALAPQPKDAKEWIPPMVLTASERERVVRAAEAAAGHCSSQHVGSAVDIAMIERADEYWQSQIIAAGGGESSWKVTFRNSFRMSDLLTAALTSPKTQKPQ